MAKKKTKQDYIDIVMETKYADDDEKYRSSNLAFLETLSIDDLKAMLNDDEELEVID